MDQRFDPTSHRTYNSVHLMYRPHQVFIGLSLIPHTQQLQKIEMKAAIERDEVADKKNTEMK